MTWLTSPSFSLIPKDPLMRLLRLVSLELLHRLERKVLPTPQPTGRVLTKAKFKLISSMNLLSLPALFGPSLVKPTAQSAHITRPNTPTLWASMVTTPATFCLATPQSSPIRCTSCPWELLKLLPIFLATTDLFPRVISIPKHLNSLDWRGRTGKPFLSRI